MSHEMHDSIISEHSNLTLVLEQSVTLSKTSKKFLSAIIDLSDKRLILDSGDSHYLISVKHLEMLCNGGNSSIVNRCIALRTSLVLDRPLVQSVKIDFDNHTLTYPQTLNESIQYQICNSLAFILSK